MQAFLYRHLVPAKELLVDVSGRARFRPVRVMAKLPVELEPGKRTRVRLAGVRPQDLARLAFDLDEAPKGIKLDLKEGGETIARVIETIKASEIGPKRTWFNGSLSQLGRDDFMLLAKSCPGASSSALRNNTTLVSCRSSRATSADAVV